MKPLRVVVSILILTLCSCSTIAKKQELEKNKAFEKSFSSFIKKVKDRFDRKHGLSIAVVKDDQLIFEDYSGYADVDNGMVTDENTSFYIASSTKSFTALAALILDSKGQIDLDRSLASYFPEISFPTELKADEINLHHLLTHTSGIQNWPIDFSKAYSGTYTDETLVRQLEKYTRAEKKGIGTFKYSNIGYNILSMILKRELGKDWKTIVDEKIFKPLKMNQTSANMSEGTRKGWKIAKGHSQFFTDTPKKLSLQKQDNTMHAAGGIISTARDLSKWLIVQLNEGKLNGKQVINPVVLKKSQEQQVVQKRKYMDLKRFGYAYGWNIALTPNKDTLVHHFGGFNGTHAEVSYIPSKKVGIAIMANDGGIGTDVSFLIASYALDYFAGRKDLDAYYGKKLDTAYADILDWKAKREKSKRERAKRKWDLDYKFADYAGIYENPDFGTLTISYLGENRLMAAMGNLKTTVYGQPSGRKNMIRFEMRPNSGWNVSFESEKGVIISANMVGMTFNRKK